MSEIDWKAIGDIKHRIRRSLVKAVKIENLAKQLKDSAIELREETALELNKLDEMIDKQNREEENEKVVIN